MQKFEPNLYSKTQSETYMRCAALQRTYKVPVVLFSRCRSLLSIGGDNLQLYPNVALFSTLGNESQPRCSSGKQIK